MLVYYVLECIIDVLLLSACVKAGRGVLKGSLKWELADTGNHSVSVYHLYLLRTS
jgi:hypothetical protein